MAQAASREVHPEDRSNLIRDIIGILLFLLAALLMLALISHRINAVWTGQIGQNVAEGLVLYFGYYNAWLLPLLIIIYAYNSMRGESATSWHGGWLRLLGALLVIVSACALFTLSVPSSSLSILKELAFQRGGLIGVFLIKAGLIVTKTRDLSLHDLLGRVGSTLLFGTTALIGVVLFTEKMVRDLFRGAWASVSQVKAFKGGDARGEGGKWVSRMPGWLGAPLEWLRQGHPLDRLREWLSRVQFSEKNKKNKRVFGRKDSAAQHEFEADDEAAARAPRGIPGEEAGARVPSRAYPAARSARQQALDERALLRFDLMPVPEPAPPVPEPRDGEGGEHDYEDYEAYEEPEVEDTVLDSPDFLSELLPPPEAAAASASGRKRRGRDGEPAEVIRVPKEFQLPGLSLLADPPGIMYEMSEEEKDRLSRKIEQALAQFKIEVQVFEVIQGPVITRFALKLAQGVRVSKISSMESDLAMALKASHVRILAPIPGQSAVGIEIPNKRANPVVLRDLLSSEAFRTHKSPLAFALGKNIGGEPVICDLAQMPHLLIAGTTGSGKSVCLNAIIASLLYKNKPDRVKFVMIDPKRVELSIYQAIPHLIAPVVSETKKAAAALAWCVEQMESRYKLLAEIGVRNLDSYNQLLVDKVPSKKILGRGDLKFLPHIVIIIDELADLMMVAKKEVEEYIIRLAQMARAVGMHLVLATQRPSVNVITGIIKANFPSRIAFAVSSKVDSRTILDTNGAETLMGRGDMLYSPGGAKPFRIQGAYVADAEVERLADYIRGQEKARYEKDDFEAKPTPAERAKAQLKTDGEGEPGSEIEAAGERVDAYLTGMAAQGRAGTAPLTPADMELLSDEDLYRMALKLVLESRKASVSYIQRRMKIGYARAGRIMDLMEERGIVGPYQGSKPRDLIVDPDEYIARMNDGAEE